jgi:hypothetical protein
MPDLKQLGAVLTWFAGAMAAVTALLYGMGFVSTVFHFNHLGIDTQFVTKDGFVYVGRGGMALFRAAPYLIVGAAFGLAAAWAVDRVVPILSWIVGRSARVLRSAVHAERRDLAAYGLFLMAIGVTLWLLQTEIAPALNDLDLARAARCAADAAACQPLVHRFGLVVIWVGFILMLSWSGAGRLSDETPGRRFVLPAFGITVLFAVGFLVPVPYGLFVIPASMTSVQLTAEDACHFELAGQQLNLVQQDASGVLLWLHGRREYRWIAAGQLHTLHLGQPSPQAPCGTPAH